jgi:hypothetical protein
MTKLKQNSTLHPVSQQIVNGCFNYAAMVTSGIDPESAANVAFQNVGPEHDDFILTLENDSKHNTPESREQYLQLMQDQLKQMKASEERLSRRIEYFKSLQTYTCPCCGRQTRMESGPCGLCHHEQNPEPENFTDWSGSDMEGNR